MLAGVAICDISPTEPIQLCGYPESPLSKGVHDPLYVSCYYFSDGTEQALYLTADLCFFARARADRITQAISEATGVAQKGILLAATHTHYAPAPDCDIYREAFGPELCPAYMDSVQSAMVDAATEAVERAFPATVSYGCGYCGREQGVGGNRHDPDRYAQDPSVNVLAIEDLRGEMRGVLVNYALHPTLLPPDTDLVSADYVGYMRKEVLKAYPDAVFGFMQGCSGNQSSRYFRREQSYAEAERFGEAIGREAVRAVSERKALGKDAALLVRRTLFYPSGMRDIPSKKDADAYAAKAREKYEAMLAAHAPESDRRSQECAGIGADMMAVYARDAEKYGKETILETTAPVELHIVEIGNLVIAGISAEVFAEVGLAVKAACPGRPVLMSCVTGGSSQSYICSDYAYEQAYYEPAGSLFGRGTAEELAENLLRQIACAG